MLHFTEQLSIAQCFICIYISNACAAGVILVLNLFMDVQSLECLDRQADARVQQLTKTYWLSDYIKQNVNANYDWRRISIYFLVAQNCVKTVSKVPSAFFLSLMKICLNFFYFYVNSFCVWCAIAGGGLGRAEETGKKVDFSNFDIDVQIYLQY